jgi:hypothetical protein
VYWDQGRGDGVFNFISNTLGYLVYTIDNSESSAYTGGLWYVIRVTAINAIGEGEYSESIAILAAEVPDAPSVPILVQQTVTEIVIRWVAPYNGGSAIRDYEIYMDILGQGDFDLLAPTSGGPTFLSYTITSALHGIVTGEIYDFSVIALNDKGSSEPSEIL